jgi:hypothetical protein
MSFASFYLGGERNCKKRQREEEKDEDALTPEERVMYLDLNTKFTNNSKAKDIFNMAPKGASDPKARQVLIALQDMCIKENTITKAHFDQIAQQMAIVDTENRGLTRSNEQLRAANERFGPIQKILDENKGLQALIFKQSTAEVELKAKVKALEHRVMVSSTHWSEHYKGEKDAMRKHAIEQLAELHWDFLDKVVDSRQDVSDDLRDCIISFMEKSRLVLNLI